MKTAYVVIVWTIREQLTFIFVQHNNDRMRQFCETYDVIKASEFVQSRRSIFTKLLVYIFLCS